LVKLLTEMVKGAGPEVARGRDISILREILDKAAARVLQLTNQPETQVEALRTLVGVYDELQLYRPMEAIARQAMAIAKRASARTAPSLQTLWVSWEWLCADGGSLNKAKPIFVKRWRWAAIARRKPGCVSA
jgi:non-specific serine/threonine protein kinase/serine/threonine-protein kinase